MNDPICVDKKYSTTRLLIQADPVIFLPKAEGRKGEGGLRTKSYLKKSYDDKPLISIITVVFNGEKYLEGTIQSVINQTYDNVEYIIIDGGSTDGTLEIIRKYEYLIDYWFSEPDEGIFDAMNKGVKISGGEWVNYMNSGDEFDRCEVVSTVFCRKEYSDAGVIYGDHRVKYNDRTMRRRYAGDHNRLWMGSQFCHQSSFVRRKYLLRYLFDASNKLTADYGLFYALYNEGIVFIKLNLFICKYMAGGVSDVDRIEVIRSWESIAGKTRIITSYYFIRRAVEFLKMKLKQAIAIE